MQITITIQTDNAAFEGLPLDEVARILRDLAMRMAGNDPANFQQVRLLDANGNTCGKVEIDE